MTVDNEATTPRYGDGNIEGNDMERNHIKNSADKLLSSNIKTFVHRTDETCSAASEEHPYPLVRLKFLGRGTSSAVYKSVLVSSMTVCAEKVVVVGDSSKRIQLLRELDSLRHSLQ